jgi:hypothetical protein
MGVYTTVAAIQSEFKSVTFGASTAVTSTDVDEFITQEETALEAEVGTIYAIPITGAAGISIMKLMATLMVKARIVDLLQVKTGDAKADQVNSGEPLRDRVHGDNGLLTKIVSKKLTLTGATLVESSGGVKSYAVDNDLTPEFQSGVDQW